MPPVFSLLVEGKKVVVKIEEGNSVPDFSMADLIALKASLAEATAVQVLVLPASLTGGGRLLALHSTFPDGEILLPLESLVDSIRDGPGIDTAANLVAALPQGTMLTPVIDLLGSLPHGTQVIPVGDLLAYHDSLPVDTAPVTVIDLVSLRASIAGDHQADSFAAKHKAAGSDNEDGNKVGNKRKANFIEKGHKDDIIRRSAGSV